MLADEIAGWLIERGTPRESARPAAHLVIGVAQRALECAFRQGDTNRDGGHGYDRQIVVEAERMIVAYLREIAPEAS